MKIKQYHFIMLFLVGFCGIFHVTIAFTQTPADTIQKSIMHIRQQLTGLEERITMAENDLFQLTKIRISGYLQAQWQNFENSAAYPYNFFSIPRARFKLKYQPYSGVAFVLEPDFNGKSVTLKDAYVRLNEPWLDIFSLWAGQFKKLNYEVEVSSSQLDVLDRSRIVKVLYPGERGLGAKLEIAPPRGPYQFEFAIFNGNENMVIKNVAGEDINPKNSDFDPFKDINARFIYHFRLGNIGGLDAGASGYFGRIKSNSTYVLKSDYTIDKIVQVGQSLTRGWFGVELRAYFDFLGGLAIKGEYLMGTNAYPGCIGESSGTDPAVIFMEHDTLMINNITIVNSQISPSIIRKFRGGYIYLVKNIGKKNKFAFRYDYYDPNISLKKEQIGVIGFDQSIEDSQIVSEYAGDNPVIAIHTITLTKAQNKLKSGLDDITYHNLSFAWSYFITDNITIQLAYYIPINEKVGRNSDGEGNVQKRYTVNGIEVVNDYSRVFPQNILTLRLQAKF